MVLRTCLFALACRSGLLKSSTQPRGSVTSKTGKMACGSQSGEPRNGKTLSSESDRVGLEKQEQVQVALPRASPEVEAAATKAALTAMTLKWKRTSRGASSSSCVQADTSIVESKESVAECAAMTASRQQRRAAGSTRVPPFLLVESGSTSTLLQARRRRRSGGVHGLGAPAASASSFSSSSSSASSCRARTLATGCSVTSQRAMATELKPQSSEEENIANEIPFGPSSWAKTYPIAVTGKRQSPIDISTAQCKCPSNFQSLRATYPESMPGLSAVNSGYAWRVDIPAHLAKKTSLQGGPLPNVYTLEQFHCHWGKECDCGSEHTVDGKSYAAELHLVHWNAERFSSFAEAAAHDKGLAVLGVFFEIGDTPHPEVDKITRLMSSMRYKDQEAAFDEELVVENLLPKDRSYWCYEGSLTTPPLYESVSWIVFKTPITVTEEQIAQFRLLCYHGPDKVPEAGDQCILENYRPPQPLCERGVASVSG